MYSNMWRNGLYMDPADSLRTLRAIQNPKFVIFLLSLKPLMQGQVQKHAYRSESKYSTFKESGSKNRYFSWILGPRS